MTKEETLKNTPTVDTTTKRTEKRTETHECDYISRQAAIKALRKGKPKETEYRGPCADSCGIGKLLQYESDISAVIALPSAQPERDIPVRPIETTDISWGIPRRQAVCPRCDYYLGDVDFLGDGKKVTYCEHCGQAIDWKEWDFNDE